MKKILMIFIFILSAATVCFSASNSTESLTISTYYPSPYGVYRNLKLNPSDTEPGGTALSPGVMYYNNSSDNIVYYNKTSSWVHLNGGGGGGGNGTYWNETSAHHIYNTNAGFVGIGTQVPQSPLTVQYSDSNAQEPDPVVARFIKHVNGVSPDQFFSFYLFPPNTWTSYLDSTTLIYTCADPPETQELAAGNQAGSIRFNVGGFGDSYSEVMRLVNSNGANLTGSGAPDGRVGIGTTNPLFPLHVETNREMTTPLMIRGMTAGYRTGMFTITPYADTVYLAYGCYLKNTDWMHDPYQYVEWPSLNLKTSYEGAKLSIEPDEGVKWSCYNSAGIGPGGKITWNVANGLVLWDEQGNWVSATCPASSRKLKENFVGMDPDDLLGKISQLEISRWNYKSEYKSVIHIGPVAEDFNRLFKTGSKEDVLHLIDSIGVSLAGVKALSGKINAQQQKIEKFKREIQGLRAQLK
ncbi:MAG: tail fiber domain-containing protein [Candidatus Omnitrophica bacterium]|nr:tail fiber domain-containing protein [Candidatus Omnitrophota bacterium]